MSTLSERIRTIRKNLHYTHELMAHELGIAQTTYSYIENSSEDKLTIGRLRKIASIFKMSLTELVMKQSASQINCVSLNKEQEGINGLFLFRTELLNSSRTIGGRIRYLREKKNLRQCDMASQIGISQKTLSLLESSDDDAQKVGRLKQVAACLLLASWTDLLPPNQPFSIETMHEKQDSSLTSDVLASTSETLHQRIQELERAVDKLSSPDDRVSI